MIANYVTFEIGLTGLGDFLQTEGQLRSLTAIEPLPYAPSKSRND